MENKAYQTTLDIIKMRRSSMAGLYVAAYTSRNAKAQDKLGRYIAYLDGLIDNARDGVVINGIEDIETVCPDIPEIEATQEKSFVDKLKSFLGW